MKEAIGRASGNGGKGKSSFVIYSNPDSSSSRTSCNRQSLHPARLVTIAPALNAIMVADGAIAVALFFPGSTVLSVMIGLIGEALGRVGLLLADGESEGSPALATLGASFLADPG